MRTVSIDPAFALALAGLRLAAEQNSDGLCSGNFSRQPTDGRVRLQHIEKVEKEFGFLLPDPVIAYLAAGVSAWGDGPVSVAAIPNRTREMLDMHERHDYRSAVPFVVIDDDSNGNYIAVSKTRNKNSDAVCFLDHEEGYDVAAGLSLTEHIDNLLREHDVRATAPFIVEVYDEPDPPPQKRWVEHVKFGKGEVVSEVDDTVHVAFESVGEKRLKRAFLTYL